MTACAACRCSATRKTTSPQMVQLVRSVRRARAAGRHAHPAQLRSALYAASSRACIPELAKQYHLPLVPFLLEKVALDPARMQDGRPAPECRG